MDNYITEDRCSLEISQLLKEKGFNVPCYSNCWVRLLDGTLIHNSKRQDERFTESIMQPTHNVAIKWIRVNFGLHIYSYQPNETGYWANNLEAKAKYGTSEAAIESGISQYLNQL